MPIDLNSSSTGGVHASLSSASDLTLETCAPRCLCIPAHLWHITTQRLSEAQSGSAPPQSAHRSLPGIDASAVLGSSCPAPLFSFAAADAFASPLPGVAWVSPGAFMDMSSAMTPCRSESHAFISSSDSACISRVCDGDMMRKQWGRPATLLSPSSAPGLTHDRRRLTTASAGDWAPVASGSGAAFCLTACHTAPIPPAMPFTAVPINPWCPPSFVSSAPSSSSGFLPPGRFHLGSIGVCATSRPRLSSTKYRLVQPLNLWFAFLCSKYPRRMAREPSLLPSVAPSSSDLRIAASADRPWLIPGRFCDDGDGDTETSRSFLGFHARGPHAPLGASFSQRSAMVFDTAPATADDTSPSSPGISPSPGADCAVGELDDDACSRSVTPKVASILRLACSIRISACALLAIEYSSISLRLSSSDDVTFAASTKNL